MSDRPLTIHEKARVAIHVAHIDRLLTEARATMTDSEYDGLLAFLRGLLADLREEAA